MIRNLLVVAATAVFLVACSPPAPEELDPATAQPDGSAAPVGPATPADPDALTASGYGPLRIGMTRAEVVDALGEDSNPDAAGGPEPEFCDQWRPARAPDGVLVMIQNGMLTRVSVASPSTLKTDRGFGVGDSAETIKAAYGPLAVVEPHKYSAPPAEDIFVWMTGGPVDGAYVEDEAARGVRYEINSEGEVQMIHIGGPAIQLVEGCA
jgi:hypothetical protein